MSRQQQGPSDGVVVALYLTAFVFGGMIGLAIRGVVSLVGGW